MKRGPCAAEEKVKGQQGPLVHTDLDFLQTTERFKGSYYAGSLSIHLQFRVYKSSPRSSVDVIDHQQYNRYNPACCVCCKKKVLLRSKCGEVGTQSLARRCNYGVFAAAWNVAVAAAAERS